jgi:(1->4)-alpha-D-glucan 1-alpha-D-glucosylmutase
VDPDNRRPVDFSLRARLLQELRSRATADRVMLVADLLRTKEDGRVKLYISERALHCRHDNPGLFTEGEYLPGDVVGERHDHLFGFARRHGTSAAVVAVPRFMTSICHEPDNLPLGQGVWGETRLMLPDLGVGQRWRNVFTGEVVDGTGGFAASALFTHMSVALLIAEPR